MKRKCGNRTNFLFVEQSNPCHQSTYRIPPLHPNSAPDVCHFYVRCNLSFGFFRQDSLCGGPRNRLLYYTLTSVVVPCSASGKADFGSIPRKSICGVRVGHVGLLSKVNGLWVALFVRWPRVRFITILFCLFFISAFRSSDNREGSLSGIWVS